MICLGIETSCDDTGLALVEDGRVIAAVLASQADVHALFGGVVPELASREHLRFIGPLFDALMERASMGPERIDLIAVTRGPGLGGSLLVGSAFAKTLALSLRKPLLGVNHLHAHLLACGLVEELVFPGLGLVVSGGHTELYRLDAPDRILRLGRTLDDAAGEVFDKVGNFCGLSYPAGKQIDELANRGNPHAFELPLPYLKNENLDFSFSGLKTAAINLASGLDFGDGGLESFCASLNRAIAETLAIKARRALELADGISAFYLAGGVAANSMIRARLQKLMAGRGGRLIAAPPRLCMDNGVMTAYTGWLLGSNGWRHELDLEIVQRGRRMPDDMKQTDFKKDTGRKVNG